MKNCPICRGSLSFFKTVYDDRYGYPGLFQVALCKSCGHKSLQADFTTESLTLLYNHYYPRGSFDLDSHRPYTEVSRRRAWFAGSYSSAFRWVPEAVRILDIGCGFGESLGYHRARGCDVYGSEVDENIRRVGEKFSYKVHSGLFDAGNYEPEFFDYVTLDQVIEHAIDPLEIMSGIAKIVKPGGTLVISTPNAEGWGGSIFGRRWIHWHTPFHLHLFSERSMRLAAEQTGYLLKGFKTLTSSDWLHLQWVHLLTAPKAGEPSVFWAPGARRNVYQRFIIATLVGIHRSKINHVLTRVFDALGIGDNHIFFLVKK